MDKPRGVKIIAIIILVFFSLSLVNLICSLLCIGYKCISPILNPGFLYFNFDFITDMIVLILDILFIIGAIGLLRYKESWRKIVICTATGFLLLRIGEIIYASIYQFSSLIYLNSIAFAVEAVLYGLLIFYFSRKKVREAFSS